MLKKKYCYILLSTFNWNLKEVLLLHTSETPRMSSKPLCEAAALSAFLFSFPSICRSFLISQLERGRVGGALLGFFSHCILMSALCSGFRQRSDVDFFLEKPLLPKLKKNLQDCKRKTPAPVELTHLLLWNFVGGKGRKSLPACDSPACPLSSCLFSWVCWFLSEPKKLDYTLPSRLTCWFLSGIIEVLDNRLFHASVGERCLQKTYHSIKRVNLSHLFLGPVLTPHHVSLFHQM